MATVSALSWNGVSKAEVGVEVPLLALEMEDLGGHARSGLAAVAHVPRLAVGVELLGEYRGSGLTQTTYLVRRAGGQVVHVSRLLYLVVSEIDASRTVGEIAAQVTEAYGRTVSAANVEYLLANKLAPLALVAAGEGVSHLRGPDPAILALKVRRTLIPAPVVQHVARLFQPLFSPFIVIFALASLIASDVWLFSGGRLGSATRSILLDPVLMLLVLGLGVLSMLFHECGHAAACRYGGARPGVIGVGFYVIWPAFFTNVTDSYRLRRAGRLRTDLGGVYFNALFALLLAATYLTTRYVPLLAAIVIVHLEIIQQLLPSLRFDGYFILTDLVGVPDLFQRIGPTLRSMIPGQPADPKVRDLKRAPRLILTAWVLVVVPLLAAELVLIVVRTPSLARTFARSLDVQAQQVAAQFGRAEVAAGLVSLISVLLLVLPTAGLCYILLLTGKRFLRQAIAANRRHRALRIPSVVAVLLVATALAVHWGLLSLGSREASSSRQVAVGHAATLVTVGQPPSDAAPAVVPSPLAARAAPSPSPEPSPLPGNIDGMQTNLVIPAALLLLCAISCAEIGRRMNSMRPGASRSPAATAACEATNRTARRSRHVLTLQLAERIRILVRFKLSANAGDWIDPARRARRAVGAVQGWLLARWRVERTNSAVRNRMYRILSRPGRPGLPRSGRRSARRR